MNVLQQERFSRLQFPVHKVTASGPEELFEILPGLRRYFQNLANFRGEVEVTRPDGSKTKSPGLEASYRGVFKDDLVKVVKYIVFVYDPDSDLIHEYPEDIRLLKEAAAKEAGFKRNKDGEWPLYITDILEFREKQVVAWIIDYLKVKKNAIWQEIKFIEEEIDSLYRARTNALQRGEVRADIMQLIKVRLEERENLYKRFYAEHTDLKKATQDELYPVSPENVFTELKIPPEVWQVRQVKDVLKETGVDQVRN